MDNRLQSDGAIYTNDYKKTEKQPDWTGKVELSKDLLKQLVEKVKAGDIAELRVALWDRTSKAGKEYKYARLDVAEAKKEEPKVEEQVEEKDGFEEDIPF